MYSGKLAGSSSRPGTVMRNAVELRNVIRTVGAPGLESSNARAGSRAAGPRTGIAPLSRTDSATGRNCSEDRVASLSVLSAEIERVSGRCTEIERPSSDRPAIERSVDLGNAAEGTKAVAAAAMAVTHKNFNCQSP